MRNWINLVRQSLTESRKPLQESVDFHPAVLSIRDGHKYVEYPEGTLGKEEANCEACDGTGEEYDERDNKSYPCQYCDGKKTYTKSVASCPELNVANRNATVILDMLGIEADYAGWIDPKDIPDLRRRLIKLKNGGSDQHTIAPSTSKSIRADTSGEIARITSGPTMIDSGVPQEQIDLYVDKILEIMDWAQKNGTGVSWA